MPIIHSYTHYPYSMRYTLMGRKVGPSRGVTSSSGGGNLIIGGSNPSVGNSFLSFVILLSLSLFFLLWYARSMQCLFRDAGSLHFYDL